MHTTQTAPAEGQERAKGAGELEDGMDAMWRYTRGKGGADAPRFLAAEGRGGVGLADTALEFADGRLSLGEGSRRDASNAYAARVVADALACELLRLKVERINYTALEKVIPGTKGNRPDMISAAVDAGSVTRDAEGRGKPTWFSLPEGDKNVISG